MTPADLRRLVANLPDGATVALPRDVLRELLAAVEPEADLVPTVPLREAVRDALEAVGWPEAIMVGDLAALVQARAYRRPWLADLVEEAQGVGYRTISNPHRHDGRWIVDGAPVVVLALRTLSEPERMAAARAVAGPHRRQLNPGAD